MTTGVCKTKDFTEKVLGNEETLTNQKWTVLQNVNVHRV